MSRITIKQRTPFPRTGTVYIAVLGVSLVVAVISIAAMHIARIEMRELVAVNEISRARLMAESGVEFAICKMKSNPLWRDDFTSGITNTPSAALSALTGSGQFDFTLTDSDGDLDDDNQDAVTLRSVGTAGSATSVVEVLLQPTGAGLSCLEASLHSAGQIFVDASTTTDQAVSANSNISISGGMSIQGDAWSTDSISGNVTGTSYPNQSPPRVMPDPTTVFKYYVANGTPISSASIGSHIERCVISPGNNPYGSQMKNSQGIYVIDCQGGSMKVRNCRIEGTLVFLNAAGGVELKDSIYWKPTIANFPALMVEGPVEMDWDRNLALSESNLGVNFNPADTPDNSVSDNDTEDNYPSNLEGLVYIDGNMTVTQKSKFTGVVIVSGTVQLVSSTNLSYQATFLNNAPPGFAAGTDMKIVPGTWKQVAN